MSLSKKLFWWRRNRPVQRIRICPECGMPVADHREWCAIFRTLEENRQRALESNGKVRP